MGYQADLDVRDIEPRYTPFLKRQDQIERECLEESGLHQDTLIHPVLVVSIDKQDPEHVIVCIVSSRITPLTMYVILEVIKRTNSAYHTSRFRYRRPIRFRRSRMEQLFSYLSQSRSTRRHTALHAVTDICAKMGM